MNVCEDDTTGNAYTSHTIEEAKLHNDPVKSVDDFMPPNKASKLSPVKSNDSDSDDDFMKSEIRRPLILGMLPDGYTYKVVAITDYNDLDSFNCEFKIKLEMEERARKWIA